MHLNNNKNKHGVLYRLFHRTKKKSSYSKEIVIYAVYNCSKVELAENPDIPPIYYAASREEAIEAVARFTFLQNYNHFKLWLSLHEEELRASNIEPDSPSNLIYNSPAWGLYVMSRFASPSNISDDDRYTVSAIAYNQEEVASFLRVLTVSKPLGMTAEKSEEIINYAMLSTLGSSEKDPMVRINAVIDVLRSFTTSDDKEFLAKIDDIIELAKSASQTTPFQNDKED